MLPQCRLRHPWERQKISLTHTHTHTLAHSSLIIAYWAARPDALGSRASVAGGKRLPSQPPKKVLKLIRALRNAARKVSTRYREVQVNSVAASLNAESDFHLYNASNQSNYRYLLSKSCFYCHSWRSAELLLLFWLCYGAILKTGWGALPEPSVASPPTKHIRGSIFYQPMMLCWH